MKKAIITGSTGLVGSAVTRFLCERGIQPLCLGRKFLSEQQSRDLFGNNVLYLQLPMNQIDKLPRKAEEEGWQLDENTIFFHFAWSGHKSLTDGDYSMQLNNAVNSAEAIKVARLMKCSKFVSSGSIQESHLEDYLKRGCQGQYQSNQTYYGLAKLASRNICSLVAYLEKIDYVHTLMSVPLAADLSRGGYVSSTMMKIFRGEEYDPPTSSALYDFILLDEVARAFYLIGLNGKNKANYFIGTGSQHTLQDYFFQFSQLCSGNKLENQKPASSFQTFDTQTLYRDTGFVSSDSLNQIYSTLRLL